MILTYHDRHEINKVYYTNAIYYTNCQYKSNTFINSTGMQIF